MSKISQDIILNATIDKKVMNIDTTVEKDPVAMDAYIDKGSGGIKEIYHDETIDGKGTKDEPLGVNTKVIATKEDLKSKQDKLTAGANIKIEDNVISSTAQESFFRGKYADWANVPTDGSLYQKNYKGESVPSYNDYIVIEDASGYVPQLDKSFTINHNYSDMFITYTHDGITETITAKGTLEEPTIVYLGDGSVKCVNQSKSASGLFIFYAERTVEIQLPDGTKQEYTAGQQMLKMDRYSASNFTVWYAPATDEYQGSWRFSYAGDWNVDNKKGWKPEYQIEEVMPIATETQAGINRTYTAGANITIVDNKISSTAQESFFRGSFADWADVPTDVSLYTEDYRGNTVPTTADYMVVKDASGYVKPGKDITITQLKMIGGEARIKITIRTTDWVLGHLAVSYNPAIIGAPGEQIEVSYATPYWSIKSLDIPVIVDGIEYEPGVVAYKFHYANTSTEYVEKILNYASVGSYEGAWRFSYIAQSWDEANKNGWYPEYQIENTLPIADATQAGIAKLYTATGTNTDGAMTQKAITENTTRVIIRRWE